MHKKQRHTSIRQNCTLGGHCRFGIVVVLYALILAGLPGFTDSSNALELDGNLWSELYVWEDGDLQHWRPYQSVQANMTAWRGSGRQRLSFHTHARWMSDFGDKLEADPQTSIRYAYARISELPSRTTINLGRQFSYTTVGSSLLDGAEVRYSPTKRVELQLFGGASVDPQNPEKMRSLSDFGVAGGRLAYRHKSSARFGLNWMYRETDDQVSYHRLGLDVSATIHHWYLYTRTAFNAANHRLAELLARGSCSRGRWYLSGELLYREPSVASNSVFSIIDFDRYRQGRLEARRKVWKDLSLTSRVQTTLFSGDDSWSGRLGVQTRIFSLGWHFQRGYRGVSNGVDGSANLQLHRVWNIYAAANISRYHIQPELDDRADAYSGRLGIARRFGHSTDVRAEVQILRNAVNTSDTRFYLRLNKGFSFK